MTMTHGSRLSALGLVLLASPVSAQSLAERVASSNSDAVTFYYTSRPNVCGVGERSIRTGQHQFYGNWNSSYASMPCEYGPVQVLLGLDNGSVTRIQYWVGKLRNHGATDLGAVSAPEAARYLMSLAQRASSNVSSKSIFPAVLADSAVIWPQLLSIARDDDRSHNTRQEATLFLSRFASAAISGHPNDPFDDEDREDRDDEKTQAVFVLSQLRNGGGTRDLLDIARNNKDAHVRSAAMFWLGQSGDPRALNLFESVLSTQH